MKSARRGDTIRGSIVGAVILATLSLPLILSHDPVGRIPVAPVWAAATHWTSTDGLLPRVLAYGLLVGSLAAVFYLLRPLFAPVGDADRARQMAASHLVSLYAVLTLEVLFYRRIARELALWAGIGGDVGSSYLLFLARVLIPGSLVFAIAATVIALLIVTRSPERLSLALKVIWAANFALLAISVMYCFKSEA